MTRQFVQNKFVQEFVAVSLLKVKTLCFWCQIRKIVNKLKFGLKIS